MPSFMQGLGYRTKTQHPRETASTIAARYPQDMHVLVDVILPKFETGHFGNL